LLPVALMAYPERGLPALGRSDAEARMRWPRCQRQAGASAHPTQRGTVTRGCCVRRSDEGAVQRRRRPFPDSQREEAGAKRSDARRTDPEERGVLPVRRSDEGAVQRRRRPFPDSLPGRCNEPRREGEIVPTNRTRLQGFLWRVVLVCMAVVGGCTRDRPVPMMSVPEGDFYMGCNPEASPRCDEDERPGGLFRLEAFELDVHEVTVGRYERCVRAGVCTAPDTAESHPGCNWGADRGKEHPVNCVSRAQAEQYCAWCGKRLPTEAEWEKAARGTDGRNYPWGNVPEPSCERAVVYDQGPGCGARSTLPVGSKPGGRSPYGLEDMLGNVYEWVADGYDPHLLENAPRLNPIGPREGHGFVMKGGAYTESYFRLSDRTGAKSRDKQDPAVGFRCAR